MTLTLHFRPENAEALFSTAGDAPPGMWETACAQLEPTEAQRHMLAQLWQGYAAQAQAIRCAHAFDAPPPARARAGRAALHAFGGGASGPKPAFGWLACAELARGAAGGAARAVLRPRACHTPRPGPCLYLQGRARGGGTGGAGCCAARGVRHPRHPASQHAGVRHRRLRAPPAVPPSVAPASTAAGPLSRQPQRVPSGPARGVVVWCWPPLAQPRAQPQASSHPPEPPLNPAVSLACLPPPPTPMCGTAAASCRSIWTCSTRRAG